MYIPHKKLTGFTAVKYLLSYLIILTVLIVGFFFITKQQITENYFDSRCNQALSQLDALATQFNDDLIHLSRVDSAIISDLELIEGRYTEDNAYSYHSLTELREYCATAKVINSIVYMSPKTNIPLSTHLPVSYKNGCFYITDSSQKTISFDPSAYLNSSFGQLVFLNNESTHHLIYFPSINQRSSYLFFYVLNTSDLLQRFKGIVSEEMPAIALIDDQNNVVVGINSEHILSNLDGATLTKGIYHSTDSTFLCVENGISRNFSLVCLLSQDFLVSQINEAFAGSYVGLLLLSILGFVLVLLAMRITYLPLRKLTLKIIPDADSRHGFLNQLESAFSEAESRNQLLQGKLENYRVSLQKSLLGSVLFSQPSSADIDLFFDHQSPKEIYIVHLNAPEKNYLPDRVKTEFANLLPGSTVYIALEQQEYDASFLIGLVGSGTNSDEQLKNSCLRLHRKYGYLAAISNRSESPLDIPVLYDSAKKAASWWPQIPVADFNVLPSTESAPLYPLDKLDGLSNALSAHEFTSAKKLIGELLDIINHHAASKGNLADFYVQCILIDALTILTNSMSLSHIKFNDFNDIYFETLYYCRSCPYTEKSKEIEANFIKLVDFYENIILEKSLSSAPLTTLIEEAYCQPDFSIATLADQFHVSVAHMSHLFKKELHVNFSDYLWAKRQERAQQLLRTTDLPIDDISVAVGYLNTSSFRRKFKQETGLTPSQFRSAYAENSKHLTDNSPKITD